jgi:hypothetical protein
LGGLVCAFAGAGWLLFASNEFGLPLGLVLRCGVLLFAGAVTAGVLKPRYFVLFFIPIFTPFAQSGDAGSGHLGPDNVAGGKAFVACLTLWLALGSLTVGGLFHWWPALALGTLLNAAFAVWAPRVLGPPVPPGGVPPQLTR